MFEKHFGLSENPFLSGPQPKYLYPSLGHQEAVAHLRHAIRNREPFVVLITGEQGVGKTIAVYDALSEWGSQAKIAMITNPALTRDELVHEIGLRLGIATGPIRTVAELELHLAELRLGGETAFLVVDEAQQLDIGLLAELTQLTDLQADGESLLHIIMIGRPSLEMLLARPDLRTLADRVGPRYLVEPLGAAETAQYLHHRVTVAGGDPQALFPADTCARLFQLTRGVPSDLNQLAGRALHQAFVAGAFGVAPEHVPIPEPKAPAEDRAAAFASASVKSLSTEGGMDVARAPAPEVFAGAGGSENGDDSERILPSWFDDIIAKRKATEEAVPADAAPVAERASGPSSLSEPTPDSESAATVAGPMVHYAQLEPFAAESDEPVRAGSIPPPILNMPGSTPGDTPPRVPTADSVEASAEALAAEIAETVTSAVENGHAGHRDEAPAAEASADPLLEFDEELEEIQQPDPNAVRRMPAPALAPIDFVEHGEGLPAVERRKSGVNPGWPVAAALVACVLICAFLIIKLLPALQPKNTPTRTSTPPPPVEAPAPVLTTDEPMPEVTPPTPKSSAKPSRQATEAGTQKPAPTPATKKTAAKEPATPAAVARKAIDPESESTPVDDEPVRVATKAPAETGQSYGISVGTYLFEDRATDRMTKLSDTSGLPAQIITVVEDNNPAYQVVLGSFGSRAAAEKKADELIERGLVQEARVIAQGRSTPKP